MASKILLEIKNVRPSFEESHLPPAIYDLKVQRGECVVIETRNLETAAAFADLCSGIVDVEYGNVSFLGMNWTELKEPRLSALRGRIGRIFQNAGWVDIYSVAVNMMLPTLHHKNTDLDIVLKQALSLCRKFGLPGLPIEKPRNTTAIDLARASCVKALLGSPDLLLLEYPFEGYSSELMIPFLETLNTLQNRGTAAICFAQNLSMWGVYKDKVTHWMRLQEKGLTTVRSI